jgi:hypothetical protein
MAPAARRNTNEVTKNTRSGQVERKVQGYFANDAALGGEVSSRDVDFFTMSVLLTYAAATGPAAVAAAVSNSLTWGFLTVVELDMERVLKIRGKRASALGEAATEGQHELHVERKRP